MRNTLAIAAACTLASTAMAGTVPVASVTASSHYTESGNYSPERIADGKQGTSWVEGDSGGGLGAWIELDLGGAHKVSGIKVWAGDWYSFNSWEAANRPKEIELKFSDDSTEKFILEDAKKVHSLEFKEREATSIRIRLKAVYSGSTWSDTGISEVQVVGPAQGEAMPAKLSASSEAKEDGDGNYAVANLSDGITDSMWCEGNTESDGKGEWVKFDFGADHAVSKVSLVNGMGSSLSLWMKGNRASSATLEFSDGSTTEIAIKPTIRGQEISFDTKKTSSVKITFTGVVAGKEFNDLCISEAYFSE